jgi:hypothetical protein
LVPTFWRNIKIKANRNPFKSPFFYWLNKNNSVKKMKKGFKEHSKCALKEMVAFFLFLMSFNSNWSKYRELERKKKRNKILLVLSKTFSVVESIILKKKQDEKSPCDLDRF